MQQLMQRLPLWRREDRIRIHGIFTDIDDTLTTDGAITPDALQSLADLKAAGLHVIPITRRPIGWSEPFSTTWPVDAIVAENGSVAFRSDQQQKDGKPLKIYQQDESLRAKNYARMQEVAQQIVREVPGAMLATDSPGRETDIAIDHSEFTHLPQSSIDQAVAIMRAAGMNATVSSIHINGWFGDHNKLEGARWIVRELFGRDLDKELDHWVYVGDSTNDQLMFKTFANSIGVANVARFVPQLKDLPKYITEGERGAGFTEMTKALLQTHSNR